MRRCSEWTALLAAAGTAALITGGCRASGANGSGSSPEARTTLALTDGRVEWIEGGGTERPGRTSEVLADGQVVTRQVRGYTEYDYRREGAWATLGTESCNLVYLTLPIERFRLRLQDGGKAPSVFERLRDVLQATREDPGWERVASIPAASSPEGHWTALVCRAEVYRARGRPALTKQERRTIRAFRRELRDSLGVVAEADSDPGSLAVERTFWFQPGSPAQAVALRELRGDLTASMLGVSRWLPGNMSPRWPIAQDEWGGVHVCLVVLRSPYSAFNVGRRAVDFKRRASEGITYAGLQWHEWRPREVVKKVAKREPLERVFDPAGSPTLRGPPLLDSQSIGEAGLKQLFLPRNLADDWKLIDAVVSGSEDLRALDYTWDATRSFVCFTFGRDQSPESTVLLLERAAVEADRREWVAAEESVAFGRRKAKLALLSGVMGDNFIALIGHGVSGEALEFLRGQLTAFGPF